jgi:hypothetical protein
MSQKMQRDFAKVGFTGANPMLFVYRQYLRSIRFFYQLKFVSFQRQLNLYGFRKIYNQGKFHSLQVKH